MKGKGMSRKNNIKEKKADKNSEFKQKEISKSTNSKKDSWVKIIFKKNKETNKKDFLEEDKVIENKKNIIKKMSRKDLLEILIIERKKIDELESELRHVKEQLSTKEIMIKNAGSIAEASLKLNKVFEKAQEAADQYLENVKKSKKK